MRVINEGSELVGVDSLKLHPSNPRIGDLDVLSESLSVNGFYGALVVQRSTRFVLAGNHRLRAAKLAGATEVPVIWVDVSDEEAEKILLADNRTSDLASYEDRILGDLLSKLDSSGGLSGSGYDADFLSELLAKLDGRSGGSTDDVPPLPDQAVSKPGDAWKLGDHVLVCGDSRVDSVYIPRELVYGPKLGRFDLVVTDPPWGVDYSAKVRTNYKFARPGKKSSVEADKLSTVGPLLERAFSLLLPKTKKGRAWFVFCSSGRPQFEVSRVLLGLEVWRQNLVWVKQDFVIGRWDFQPKHETILYGWTPGSKHRAPLTRDLTTVLEFDRPQSSDLHPTTKPVDLLAFLVETSSRRGELVVDPFAGSGSTLIACEQTGRRCYSVEIDPAYCDVIVERWQALSGGQATR